jgi:hypothetical protein
MIDAELEILLRQTAPVVILHSPASTGVQDPLCICWRFRMLGLTMQHKSKRREGKASWPQSKIEEFGCSFILRIRGLTAFAWLVARNGFL